MLRIDNLSTNYNIYIIKFFLNDLKENFKGGLKISLNIIVQLIIEFLKELIIGNRLLVYVDN